MFKKILIANRGVIALRVIRACRDMGIGSVALYSRNDRESLHVRLADECMPLYSEHRYGDQHEVLAIARAVGADAIHPGCGFLAEKASFARACAEAGITFIGPPSDVIEQTLDKIEAMERVRQAGFPVPLHSTRAFGEDDDEALREAAMEIGYPLVLKARSGGRGRGSRVVPSPDELDRLAAAARREAMRIYGENRLYLEKTIMPSHYVAVQVLADAQGNRVHLGEREGSVLLHNQKLIEESPAPCLNDEQRRQLWDAALEITRLFDYRGVGSVEFLVDGDGGFHFIEMKSRIQIGHPVNEMVSGVGIVNHQIRIAAGEPLSIVQDDIQLNGNAIKARVNAQDPWNNYLPSPGRLGAFRLPGGPGVRADTYGYVGCNVLGRFDSLLANVVAWGENRERAVSRLRRALQEFRIHGVQSNLPLHLKILNHEEFLAGSYETNLMRHIHLSEGPGNLGTGRDLAVAAAVAWMLRNRQRDTQRPQRLDSGWHRSSRRLPE